jgi:hypothetical protein
MINNLFTASFKNWILNPLRFKKKPLILLLILCSTSISIYAQIVPQGKANLIEFNSNNAVFIVPEGKTWYVYNVFCERKSVQDTEESPNAIVLKRVNNLIFKKGPLVYLSESAINFPLIFPEKTTFELEILSSIEIQATMTYIETDN